MNLIKAVFAKRQQLKYKILLPFVGIISMVVFSCTFLAIYMLETTMEKHSKEVLSHITTTTEEHLNHIVQHIMFITNLAPHISPLNKETFHHISKQLPYPSFFDWDDVSIHTYLDHLTEDQKKRIQARLPISKKDSYDNHFFVYHHNQDISIDIATMTMIKQGKQSVPILITYPLDNHIIKYLHVNPTSELAILYHGFYRNKPIVHILVATEKILSSPLLQEKLKYIVSSPAFLHEPHFFQTFKIDATYYKTLFKKLDSYSDISLVVMQTSNKEHQVAIRLILSMILVVFVISLVAFAIYAIIIKKITTAIDMLAFVSKKVAEGDLEQHIYLEGKDEIGELSHIFNSMMLSLRETSKNLIAEKERSEAIVSSIPEGVIVTDLEDRLILANKKAEEMFNFSQNEVQGKFLSSYIHNEDLMRVYKQKWKDSEQALTRHVRISDQNNQYYIYQLTSTFVSNKQKYPIGIITVLRDLTQQKQIEELKDGFLRTVSHELRTPLTSVMGFIELVMSSSSPALTLGKHKEYLATALKEASNLKSMIDDLLDLSQLHATKMEMILTTVHVQSFIDELIKSLSPLAKAKNLKLYCKLKNSQLKITADSGKLRRIFLNLISNAIKFTIKGFVEVGYIEKENTLEFFVRDSGIGLRDNQKHVIFERFRQVDFSSRREHNGIGLGLSIVKQLVTMHKGHVWVDSIYEKGTTFFFTIKKGL